MAVLIEKEEALRVIGEFDDLGLALWQVQRITDGCKEAVAALPAVGTLPCATYSQVSKALCGKENATVDEMLRAVEQLNRRAEPENRVLGLGEAQRICAKGDAVWLEEMVLTIPTRLSNMTLAHVSFLDEQTGACYIHTFFVEFPLMAEKYGKIWRCWMRKPTAEEMARYQDGFDPERSMHREEEDV